MTTLKPYLIRAIYEWILDNNLTPYLLVDATNNNALLPQQFVEDGKIILNIRPEATYGLTLGNERIEFNAKFSGKPMGVVVPISAVLALYAKENGKGMVFEKEDNNLDDNPPPEKPTPTRPTLRVVK